MDQVTGRGNTITTGVVEVNDSGSPWEHGKDSSEDSNWKEGPSHEGGSTTSKPRDGCL